MLGILKLSLAAAASLQVKIIMSKSETSESLPITENKQLLQVKVNYIPKYIPLQPQQYFEPRMEY